MAMSKTYKALKIDQNGPVWRIALNRPEVRNAHDLATFKELVSAFDERVEGLPKVTGGAEPGLSSRGLKLLQLRFYPLIG